MPVELDMWVETVEHNGKKYKLCQDVYYHIDTHDDMVRKLRHLQHMEKRVIIHYGDPKTGKFWGDQHIGRISNTGGSVKIPIMLYNSTSIGGAALLTHCIVAIYTTKGNHLLYKHTKYHN